MNTFSFLFYLYFGSVFLPHSVATAGERSSNSETMYSRAISSEMAATVYQYPTAENGACIDFNEGDAASILNRNGILVRGGPSANELTALAKGIGQVEKLLGSPLPLGWRTPFNYINTTSYGTWNQAVYAVNVRRPAASDLGENVGRLMHELGHKVGNSGVYGQYRNFVSNEQCKITTYATTKSNEQFAEVFAAFVTYPDKLAKSCPRAYRFFSQNLFPNSSEKVASCESYDKLQQTRWNSSHKNFNGGLLKNHKHKSLPESNRGDNQESGAR